MSKHLINRLVFVEYYLALVFFIFLVSVYYFFFEYADRFLGQEVMVWFYERFSIIIIVMMAIFLGIFFYLMYRCRQLTLYLEITPERLKIIEQKKEKIISQAEIARRSIENIQLIIRQLYNRHTKGTYFSGELLVNYSGEQKKLFLPLENSLNIMNELSVMQYPVAENSLNYQEQIMAVQKFKKTERSINKWAWILGIIGFVLIIVLTVFLMYFLRDYWV